MRNNPVYICHGLRTGIGKFAGTMASVRPDDMLAHVVQSLNQQAGINPESIDEVIIGCANQAGEDNRNIARMSTLLAEIPVSVPAITVNRLCASGMDAIAMASRSIAMGDNDLVIAGGVESMSRAPLVMPKAEMAFSRKAEIYDTTLGWRFINKSFNETFGTDSMPETGENVAEQFSISREDQDKFAYQSQQKAARNAELRQQEIVSLSIARRKKEPLIFNSDEHARAETTLEKLKQLGTPFRKNGSVTAGNASGVNDGACALILASEEAVKLHQLTPITQVLGFQSAGVMPNIMGIGPVPAVEKLLKRHSLATEDIDVIELNEAFASQSLAVLRSLNIDDDDSRVNAWGGAIALGHPLGMSGARLVLTASRQLQQKNAKIGLCTMCVGVGQGVAMLIERV